MAEGYRVEVGSVMTPTLGEEGGVVKGNTDKPGTVVHGAVQVSDHLLSFLLNFLPQV